MPESKLPRHASELTRSQSPQHMFEQIALEHQPLCAFDQWPGDFTNWKAATWPRVLATLGDFPARPPLNPVLVAEWEDDGLRKQRWLIDVHAHMAASFLINYPPNMAEGELRPALFCWHGHSYFGKNAVMNTGGSEGLKADIRTYNHSYGHQMAKAGFITFAIDWIGGGERSDANWPNQVAALARGRDWCNLYYLHATMLGMTSLSINLTHGQAATDFACSLPGVDPDRLGVMGLSGGGTMALWSGLFDDRFKATEIICYSDLWPIFGVRDLTYCGMQVAPGLFKLVDLHDLQGLLAPRPLLIDIGTQDTCFHLEGALACFGNLQPIYAAAEASDHLWLDLFPGEHAWGGNKSVEFFRRYLTFN